MKVSEILVEREFGGMKPIKTTTKSSFENIVKEHKMSFREIYVTYFKEI